MKKRMILICLLLALLIPASAMACTHKFGHWKTKTSATCTRQGHQFRYCQKCDHWEQRHTPKLKHTPGEMTVTKEATCTETGKQEAICQACGNLVRYTIQMKEHNYGEMKVAKEPTCASSGVSESACADCGKVKRENIAKLGHEYGEMKVTKEPTCSATGTGEAVCLRCGKAQTKKINAIEHPYGEWNVTREPDGKHKGMRVSTCTMCGREMKESFYNEGTLYKDMKACPEVIAMQEKLRDLGMYNGSINSGKFGQLTAEAVSRFQQSIGMEGTGVADSDTLGALDIAWEKATGKTAAETLNAQEMENADKAKEIAE